LIDDISSSLDSHPDSQYDSVLNISGVIAPLIRQVSTDQCTEIVQFKIDMSHNRYSILHREYGLRQTDR